MPSMYSMGVAYMKLPLVIISGSLDKAREQQKKTNKQIVVASQRSLVHDIHEARHPYSGVKKIVSGGWGEKKGDIQEQIKKKAIKKVAKDKKETPVECKVQIQVSQQAYSGHR